MNVRCIVLLSFLAPAQALRDANLAVQHEVSEHRMLAKLELPLKPQRNGTFLKEEVLAQALAETKEKTLACNEKNSWKASGKEIGRGKNGVVLEVFRARDKTRSPEMFALKEALKASGNQEVVSERIIMQAASDRGCMNVMPVIDAVPCFEYTDSYGTNSYTLLNYAYVSKNMESDLWHWLQGAETEDRARCAHMVAEQLSNGLSCLHASGYIHGDFKADNILYDQTLSNGCPGGLRLADFGLSFPVGKYHDQYEAKYYAGSTHLIDSMFQGQTDTSKIADRRTWTYTFLGSTQIDWCSFNTLMQTDFALTMEDLGYSATEGSACGYMGTGRRQYYYGNTKPSFSWSYSF
jgi:hypothetical protein